MNAGLRELLGLPDRKQRQENDEFRQSFRDGMAGLNGDLQKVAAQGDQAAHEKLDAQRQKLYAAYQASTAQGDASANKRVMAAATQLKDKASTQATNAQTAKDDWLKLESTFDEALAKIGDLEDAGHPKAGALLELSKAIRGRVTGRKYREAVTLLDQLLPKLEKLHTDSPGTISGNAEKNNSTGLTAEEREAMWKEIEEIERRLELLLAEHQIA